MALTSCPECGHQVSDSAAACPNCGFGVAEYFESQSPSFAEPGPAENLESKSGQPSSMDTVLGCVMLVVLLAMCGGAATCLGTCDDEPDETSEAVQEDRETRQERLKRNERMLKKTAEAGDWLEARRYANSLQAQDRDHPLLKKYLPEIERHELERAKEQLEVAKKSENWGQVKLLAEKVVKLEPENETAATLREAADVHLMNDRASEAVEAANTFLDGTKCGSDEYIKTLDGLKSVWQKLGKVTDEADDYRKARSITRKLERCRKRAVDVTDRRVCEIGAEARKHYADKLDELFLDSGMDVRIKLRGKCKTRIRMTWALWNRATVRRIEKEANLTRNLEDVGFERADFYDGFSETVYYELEPTTMAHDRQLHDVLQPRMMDKPLKL